MTQAPSHYFVVGIGASAGGLNAAAQLLSQIPENTPLALILIQHLGRDQPSELAELLGRSSNLPVNWISDQVPLAPGHVYVLPPDQQVKVEDGVLILEKRKDCSVTSTIDDFFFSLAEDCKERSIAVILSGTGSDGISALRAIKAAGGLVFVQEESTASFPGMARAAIDAGEFDLILPPKKIAEELVKLAEQGTKTLEKLSFLKEDEAKLVPEAETWTAIFRLIAIRKGVNFSDYKQSTIMRRLVRRMMLTKTQQLADYLKLLQKDRSEMEALYEGLLINVTSFFRDPECFDFLREQILPGVLASHADGSPIRMWVPGCSTGEEAYSLGMLVAEVLDGTAHSPTVQIFATDISDQAIAFARHGVYSAADLSPVSPERQKRFFLSTERGFVVRKTLRDKCIFARQNVTKDSPFSRLDLISCRNLLIYLGPALQKKLMPIFHYALDSSGHLVLGSSESVGAHVDLFRMVDRRFRIYSRKSASRRTHFDFANLAVAAESPVIIKPVIKMPEESKDAFDVMREADRVVLGRHSPPGVLVNDELEILQFRGNVVPYLSLVPGRASLSLLKMAIDGLAAELESGVREAKESGIRIRRQGIALMIDDEPSSVDLDITPIDSVDAKERFYLILFIAPNTAPAPKPRKAKGKAPKDNLETRYLAQIDQLKQDLAASRNYLQSTIEKHEGTNQELRAANAEIQSSNEELQSTNEELETAKEELQSTNEELTTVNEELHSRQSELIQVNNDLTNLINSVHLPIIILDQDLRIRRFTPMAERVLNVIPTDIGRPLSDLKLNLSVNGLPRLISEVMESLTVQEMEVQNEQGRWYSMRLRPYKTAENRIDGVVVTLIDIDPLKRTITELENTRHFAFAIGDAVPNALVGLNAEGEVQVANDAFHQLFGISREQTQGRRLFDVLPSLCDVKELRDGFVAVASTGNPWAELNAELTSFRSGRISLKIAVRQAASAGSQFPLTLISFQPY